MKFTLSWLKSFLDTNASLEEILTSLTMIGLEVEEVIGRAQELADFEVAEIIEAASHPDEWSEELLRWGEQTASTTLLRNDAEQS